MTTLYLVRHTTPDISPGICYGQTDIGVTNSFEVEANKVLNWLPALDLILTSPLLRTRKLADYLAQSQRCKVNNDARLMEKHFGAWEGCAWNDIPRHEIDEWAGDIMNYVPPDGESAQQLMQRVQDFLLDLEKLPEQHIALVAHAGSIRALLAQLAKMPLTDTLHWEIAYGTVIGVKFAPSLKTMTDKKEIRNNQSLSSCRCSPLSRPSSRRCSPPSRRPARSPSR